MEGLLNIDWQTMFVPQESLVAVLIRGTIMYLGMFTLLRIFRRQAGSISIADVLLIVVIADAAQHGMSGEAKSVTEAMLLIGVIVFWDYFIDWLGFKSEVMSRLLEPQPIVMIQIGRMIKRNMDRERITEEELMSRLREQGVDDISDVKKCCLESDGEFSVIRHSKERSPGDKSKKGAI